jgi:di/tricarboxylate transporter
MVVGLFSDRMPPVKDLLSGFASEGLWTVAALFVVAAGLSATGAMQRITTPLLGRPSSTLAAQARLTIPVATLSGFLNNTPLVAMFLPVVNDWCRRQQLSPSKLFMPLSFAAVLGGLCTIIGTSTNLVVNGLLINDPDHPRTMGFFTVGAIGLPCAIVGVGYLLIAGRWLLPDRRPAIQSGDDARQYTVEMLVDDSGVLDGQTIENAGLRHLPGLYLTEIERNGDVMSVVGPETKLFRGDRLVFVGVLDSVVDLRNIRGLLPASNQADKLNAPTHRRKLVEAVVSDHHPLIGKTIRQGRFRTTYHAAVIAAARNGQRLIGKIGDIVLQPGDTLLLEAGEGFVERNRNRRDFYLVSGLDGPANLRHERAWVALVVLGALVTMGVAGVPMLHAGLIAAGLIWLSRCITGNEARNAIDWQVLVVIGAAMGIGNAVLSTGLAQGVANGLLGINGQHPWLALCAIYVLTNVFTELLSNNAAAVLVYPIAKATAMTLGVDLMPFVIVLMIAASAGFATPIGYQTNLMVYGPGNYRFLDYTRMGLPLNALVMAVTVTLTPWVFPF